MRAQRDTERGRREDGGVSAIFDEARVKTHAHGGRQTEITS